MREEMVYEQAGVAMTCRGYDEYLNMFHVNLEELQGQTVLDVAAGASSFAAEASERGLKVTAADPMYAEPHQSIYGRSLKEIEESTAKLYRIRNRFDWTYYGTLDRHRATRLANLEKFAADYREDADRAHKTYIAASLPNLPFAERAFDVVLCSHFLFLYADQLSESFHMEAVRELVRVSRRQVRIYPLLTLRWEAVSYLDDLIGRLQDELPVRCERIESRLAFIPGSHSQLCITRLDG